MVGWIFMTYMPLFTIFEIPPCTSPAEEMPNEDIDFCARHPRTLCVSCCVHVSYRALCTLDIRLHKFVVEHIKKFKSLQHTVLMKYLEVNYKSDQGFFKCIDHNI